MAMMMMMRCHVVWCCTHTHTRASGKQTTVRTAASKIPTCNDMTQVQAMDMSAHSMSMGPRMAHKSLSSSLCVGAGRRKHTPGQSPMHTSQPTRKHTSTAPAVTPLPRSTFALVQ